MVVKQVSSLWNSKSCRISSWWMQSSLPPARSCLHAMSRWLLIKYYVILYLLLRNPAHIRLHGGDKPWNGYAQTYYAGNWGSICNTYPQKEGWPTVFCKELGYSKAKEAHRRGMCSKFSILIIKCVKQRYYWQAYMYIHMQNVVRSDDCGNYIRAIVHSSARLLSCPPPKIAYIPNC